METHSTKTEAYECVKLIQEHGGDPKIPDPTGKKSAYYAVRKKFSSVIKLLLDNGGILDDVERFFICFEDHVNDEILECMHTMT